MPAISLNSASLLAAVKLLMPLVPNNPVVPVLENLRLLAVGNTLQLAASNLEADLATETALSDATTGFDICLPAKLLLTTLQNLPSQPITLHLDSDTNAVTLRAGKGRYRLPGENSVSWPNPSASKATATLTLPGVVLAQALRHTTPFVSSDTSRPSMNSVLLDLRSADVRAVATDSHRMSWATVPDDTALASRTGHFIVPPTPARLLAGLAEKAESISLELGEWLCVNGPGWVLRCRLVDERYPDYECVIPTSNPLTLLVDKQALITCIKRVLAYAAEKTNQIGLRMRTSQPLRLWAESIDSGTEAVEEVDAEFDGEDMEMGFNGKYLLESLQVMPDGPVRFALSTPNRAAVLDCPTTPTTAPRFNQLLMPVMLASSVPAA